MSRNRYHFCSEMHAVLNGLVALVALITASCAGISQSSVPLYDRLSGRGPVLLSQNNPYLPADRLLDEHIKSSRTFREVIGQRGRPVALSVERSFFEPTTIVLFYPDREQQVTFQSRGTGWVRSERDFISLSDIKKIRTELASVDVGVPMANPAVSGFEDSYLERSTEVRARLSPRVFAKEAGFKRLLNGDYQHTVSFGNETLEAIATWYTGTATHRTALARASGISHRKLLSVGDVITIPQRLIKNPKALPESALQ